MKSLASFATASFALLASTAYALAASPLVINPATGAALVPTPDNYQFMINAEPWSNGRGLIQGPVFRDNYQAIHDIINNMGTWTNGVFTPNLSLIAGDLVCPGGSMLCTVNKVMGALPAAVSLTSFGAVANVNTAAAEAANVAALQAAYSVSPDVYCPSGATFYTTGEAIPANANSLVGTCKFVAGVGFVDGNPVVRLPTSTSSPSLRVVGIEADAPLGSFSSAYGFFGSGNGNVVLEDVRSTAPQPIVIVGASQARVKRATVGGYGGSTIGSGVGITVSGTFVDVSESTVVSPNMLNGSCIQVGGSFIGLEGNNVQGCGQFGYAATGNSSTNPAAYVTVTGNHAYNTRVEAMNFSNVFSGAVSGNTTVETSLHTDFGTSFGTTTSLSYTGNSISGACKAGLGLADGTIGDTFAQNLFTNVGACMGRQASFTATVSTAGIMNVTSVASGTIGHVNDTVTGAGLPSGVTVQIYGAGGTTGTGGTGTYQLIGSNGANLSLGSAIASETITSAFNDIAHSNAAIVAYSGTTTNNVIGPNTVQDFYSPQHLSYDASEVSGASGNEFMPFTGSIGTLGMFNITGAGSYQGPMVPGVSYPVTLACSGGGTITATGSFYYIPISAKLLYATFRASVSAVSSCLGVVTAKLPVSGSGNVPQQFLFGREDSATGNNERGQIAANSATMTLLQDTSAASGSPATSAPFIPQPGYVIDLNGSYATP